MTELNVSATPQETVHAAAEYVASLAEARALDQGRFTVALSGGSTPRLLYEMLAIRPDSDRIMWDNWQVFWSDERCVPPGHKESNYRMAKEALLDQVPISAACIYRVRGEIEPREAAEEYEALIKNVFHVPMPSFHLILLGVGEDGHTASLFPGTQAMDEKDRLVAANPAPSGGASRITFTLPLSPNPPKDGV